MTDRPRRSRRRLPEQEPNAPAEPRPAIDAFDALDDDESRLSAPPTLTRDERARLAKPIDLPAPIRARTRW